MTGLGSLEVQTDISRWSFLTGRFRYVRLATTSATEAPRALIPDPTSTEHNQPVLHSLSNDGFATLSYPVPFHLPTESEAIIKAEHSEGTPETLVKETVEKMSKETSQGKVTQTRVTAEKTTVQ